MNVGRDEFSLIRQWTKPSLQDKGDGLVVGIGDDAAVFAVSAGREVVACCDAMIETVHFLKSTMNPADIGYKAMISNISDIAAMGGIPRFSLVTIGVSPNWTPDECQQIYDGMYEACRDYGVRIIGGDTVSAPDAMHLSVTLLGEVESGKALLRRSARPGDAVFVTGTVGGSAAGLHALFQARDTGEPVLAKWQQLITFHQRPAAQVQAGRLLLSHPGMGACNDVSDGLASELWEVAEASGVTIHIDQERIPIHPDVRGFARQEDRDPYQWAFFGGEDYQLTGTVAQEHAEALQRLFEENGLSVTLIGRVEAGEGPNLLMTDTYGTTQVLHKAGYNHFSQS
ncbi:thiamine-phosphate kinase [Brevibacillus dissolubilis]|uniref:thiamine-phosphate kinase n=1 Tax=Brevibacillus dissolubilis TaxID=1844116 RepID=UPI0021001D6A|nr:thiamine-phosphate kinase [Brevibacillus dissolubilis]